MNLKNNRAFTLIEIMVWIIIVSIVLIWWFRALVSITIWKTKLIQQTDIQKESFYFTEKLFEMIKKWWLIDYEEYFNRRIIWNTTYLSWHFLKESWFGNFWRNWVVWSNTFWEWFYYCRSDDWTAMTWTGCFTKFNSGSIDYLAWNEQQRFWEYSFQFRDYNSNYDDDWGIPWDEDWDGNVIWDDDDEYLWVWPDAFIDWSNLNELYLISGNKKERTYFRWYVEPDPALWSSANCTFDPNNNITGTWCLWNIQYLKLEWKDWWMDHVLWSNDNTESDWVIDTWIINPEFTWWSIDVAWTWSLNWVSLFPDNINVSEFKIYAYPNKDIEYDWKNDSIWSNISPYIILKMKLKPSWKSRRQIWWEVNELDFSMTINLSDIYSN